MLTAEALGGLPPVAKLSSDQAMEHFIAGHPARVAGTEAGLGRHPEAPFSTCLEAPFLPRAPAIYGRLLQTLLQRHNTTCWPVDTAWTGAAHGSGHRMSLPHARAIRRAVAKDGIAAAMFEPDPSSVSRSRTPYRTCRARCWTHARVGRMPATTIVPRATSSSPLPRIGRFG